MHSIEMIIATLSERILSGGTWTISVDELESLIDPVTLYRAVYERGLIGTDLYDLSSAGELITLLEQAASPHAESLMREAGLFLSHDDRIDLTGRFVRFIKRATVLHVPDPEIFRGMLGQFRRYDIAEETYCDSYLPLSPLILRCAAEHAEDQVNGSIYELTARWYLQTLVDRQIVVLSDLAPALFELLRAVGRQEGSLPPIGGEREEAERARKASESAHESERGKRAAALAILEIDSTDPAREVIQGQYRLLMRRFHPDVNPDGLETAKRINAAYALLITNADRR